MCVTQTLLEILTELKHFQLVVAHVLANIYDVDIGEGFRVGVRLSLMLLTGLKVCKKTNKPNNL